MRTLATRRNYQTAPRAFVNVVKERAPSGRRRRNRRFPGRAFECLLCPGISASPWFTASCFRDGSLAVIPPLWVQTTSEVPSMFEGLATSHTCAHSTSNACTSLGKQCVTAHLSQTSPYDRVQPHLAGNVNASVRASGIEKDLVPPLVPLLPRLSIAIAASETVVSTKNRGSAMRVLMDWSWLHWVDKLLPACTQGSESGGQKNCNFDHLAAAKCSRLQPTLWDPAE